MSENMFDDQDEDDEMTRAIVESIIDGQGSPVSLKHYSTNDVDAYQGGLNVHYKAIVLGKFLEKRHAYQAIFSFLLTLPF